MPNTTTEPERKAARAEAERRVRAGEERNAVARALGVHPSTLRDWALAGGWRRRDLANDPAMERQAAEAQARLRHAELDRLDKTRNRARDLVEKARVARDGMDREGIAPPPVSPRAPQEFALAYAQALMEEGRIAEAERAARFAMHYAQAAALIDKLAEPQWRRQQRDYNKWQEIWRGDLELQEELIANSEQLQEEIARLQSREREQLAAGARHVCSTPLGEDDDFGDTVDGAFDSGPEVEHAPQDPAPASVIDDDDSPDEEIAAEEPSPSDDAGAHPAPASVIGGEAPPAEPADPERAARRRAYGMKAAPPPASAPHIEPG